MVLGNRTAPLLIVLAAMVAAPTAIAQQPAAPANTATPVPPAGAKDRQERREERREEAKERREEAKERREEAKENAGERREERQERREEVKGNVEERRKVRQERRKERREEIRKRWGDAADRPEARAELRVHARRVARLNRIKALAQEAGKTDVVERADKLIAKEQERHQRAMDQIKAKGGKP